MNHTLQMVKNDRTAGYIPSFNKTDFAARNKIESTLTNAGNKEANTTRTLSYQDQSSENTIQTTDESFGFADLLDMVNPLQHIPLVSHVYRELTGDEIKPVSKVIGGAVFGGPAGAASGLVNIVVENETGKDLTGNAISLVTNDKTPDDNQRLAQSEPETVLSNAQEKVTYEDLPASLLAFAGTGLGNQPQPAAPNKPKNTIAANGRTAGYIATYA
ncbi:MAG: hypothetical protein KDI13_06315 [Alphaproteobacteria bacterium]|nr:hypothetical protein [Alphaproteobacteria bacterium]